MNAELPDSQARRPSSSRAVDNAGGAADEVESERLRALITTADAALEAKRAEREPIPRETEERVGEAKVRAQPTEVLEREQREQGRPA